LGGQFFNKIGGLLERHVAIVVAMDQQPGSVSSRQQDVVNLSNVGRL
jgi:hypothetical protein